MANGSQQQHYTPAANPAEAKPIFAPGLLPTSPTYRQSPLEAARQREDPDQHAKSYNTRKSVEAAYAKTFPVNPPPNSGYNKKEWQKQRQDLITGMTDLHGMMYAPQYEQASKPKGDPSQFQSNLTQQNYNKRLGDTAQKYAEVSHQLHNLRRRIDINRQKDDVTTPVDPFLNNLQAQDDSFTYNRANIDNLRSYYDDYFSDSKPAPPTPPAPAPDQGAPTPTSSLFNATPAANRTEPTRASGRQVVANIADLMHNTPLSTITATTAVQGSNGKTSDVQRGVVTVGNNGPEAGFVKGGGPYVDNYGQMEYAKAAQITNLSGISPQKLVDSSDLNPDIKQKRGLADANAIVSDDPVRNRGALTFAQSLGWNDGIVVDSTPAIHDGKVVAAMRPAPGIEASKILFDHSHEAKDGDTKITPDDVKKWKEYRAGTKDTNGNNRVPLPDPDADFVAPTGSEIPTADLNNPSLQKEMLRAAIINVGVRGADANAGNFTVGTTGKKTNIGGNEVDEYKVCMFDTDYAFTDQAAFSDERLKAAIPFITPDLKETVANINPEEVIQRMRTNGAMRGKDSAHFEQRILDNITALQEHVLDEKKCPVKQDSELGAKTAELLVDSSKNMLATQAKGIAKDKAAPFVSPMDGIMAYSKPYDIRRDNVVNDMLDAQHKDFQAYKHSIAMANDPTIAPLPSMTDNVVAAKTAQLEAEKNQATSKYNRQDIRANKKNERNIMDLMAEERQQQLDEKIARNASGGLPDKTTQEGAARYQKHVDLMLNRKDPDAVWLNNYEQQKKDEEAGKRQKLGHKDKDAVKAMNKAGAAATKEADKAFAEKKQEVLDNADKKRIEKESQFDKAYGDKLQATGTPQQKADFDKYIAARNDQLAAINAREAERNAERAKKARDEEAAKPQRAANAEAAQKGIDERRNDRLRERDPFRPVGGLQRPTPPPPMKNQPSHTLPSDTYPVQKPGPHIPVPAGSRPPAPPPLGNNQPPVPPIGARPPQTPGAAAPVGAAPAMPAAAGVAPALPRNRPPAAPPSRPLTAEPPSLTPPLPAAPKPTPPPAQRHK